MNLDAPRHRRAENGDPLALTEALVSIPSVNPALEAGGTAEAEIARACADWLGRWSFDVRLVEVTPGRFNVIGTVGGEGPTVLLNGHLDTVGVSGMTVDPFEPKVSNGRLYGRGSCDMKAGIAALLAAGKQVADDPDFGGRLIVALTADEEHASIGMEALVREGVVADCAIVCEPTELAVMPAHKGFVWITVEFEGVAAHGSRPEVGIDAIRHAAEFLVELDRYEEALRRGPAHTLLGHPSIHAGTIQGGSAPSVYPGRCTLVLEQRLLPGESPEQVEAAVRALVERVAERVPDLSATVTRGLYRPGTEVSIQSELVSTLLESCRAVDVAERVEGMTAWVDAAFLNEAGIPTVCFGPGSIEHAHTADESVSVEEVERAAEVLTHFVLGFTSRPR